MIVPIILAGGVGSRLWPLSRKNHPKQMLKLVNHLTMLQSTLQYIQTLQDCSLPIIVTHEEQRFSIAEQIRQVNQEANILLERKSLNTAFAVSIGTLFAASNHINPLILVLPSDHYIPESHKFAKLISEAIPVALEGKLVIFGVEPTSVNTEFGYIKRGKKINNNDAYYVDHFVEKPDLKTAQDFLETGEYYWNAGIFLYQASSLRRELEKYAPRILSCAESAIKGMEIQKDFIYLGEISKEDCPNLPLDKAIFEKVDEAVVFPFNFEWLDLGDYNALYKIGTKDKDLNVVHGNVVSFDTQKCYLFTNKSLLVTSGISDCLVVATEDAILVSRLDKKQDIKKIVEHLSEEHYTSL